MLWLVLYHWYLFILGHSFVCRLQSDLGFDVCAESFGLRGSANVLLFSVGRRTVFLLAERKRSSRGFSSCP